MTTLELPPHVDGPQVHDLREQLREALAAGPEVVLDCSRVEVLSAPGQALLLSTARAARRRGGLLVLRSPTEAMTHALRTTGLDLKVEQATSRA